MIFPTSMSAENANMSESRPKYGSRLWTRSISLVPDPHVPTLSEGIRQTIPDNLPNISRYGAEVTQTPTSVSDNQTHAQTSLQAATSQSSSTNQRDLAETDTATSDEGIATEVRESIDPQQNLPCAKLKADEGSFERAARILYAGKRVRDTFEKRGIVFGSVFHDAQEYLDQRRQSVGAEPHEHPEFVPPTLPQAPTIPNETQTHPSSHTLQSVEIPVTFCTENLRECIPMVALLDTGSQSNLIRESALSTMGFTIDANAERVPLRVANNEVLYCLGSCQISTFLPAYMGFGGMPTEEVTFLVAPDALPCACIIGWQFIKEHGLLQWAPAWRQTENLLVLTHEQSRELRQRQERDRQENVARTQEESARKAKQAEEKKKKAAENRTRQSAGGQSSSR